MFPGETKWKTTQILTEGISPNDQLIKYVRHSWLLIARIMGPTWDPSGAERTQVGPMLAPWTLLSALSPVLPFCITCPKGTWIIPYIYYISSLTVYAIHIISDDIPSWYFFLMENCPIADVLGKLCAALCWLPHWKALCRPTQIAKFMGPTWGLSRSCQPQMGPMLAPWTLLSGYNNCQISSWWMTSLLCR